MRINDNDIYRDMTAEEISAMPATSAAEQIALLKQNLLDTDYMAIKRTEGWITDDEYASVKAQRQAWRDEINELEEQTRG